LVLPKFQSLDDWSIEIGLLESVAEACLELIESLAPAVEWHRAAYRRRDRAKLVDAVAMVAMGVGDDHCVEGPDTGVEQLLAQVRTAIDQDLRAGAFDQDRRAQPAIARLFRIAPPPVIADLGDAGRRPAAEDPDFHAALLNNLKKLAVVASASSSSGSPRSAATKAAVSATKAGSHFCPRCGTGARKGE